jgi:hypothetical protein
VGLWLRWDTLAPAQEPSCLTKKTQTQNNKVNSVLPTGPASPYVFKALSQVQRGLEA